MIPINKLISLIQELSNPLFKKVPENTLSAIFDKKGFWFDSKAENEYNYIKDKPHIYVVFTNNLNGYYYIGISNQKGGRWKRSHAYHLGTLAYHLLGNIQKDDQNHKHWIDSWMDENTLQINDDNHSIQLKEEVFIAFLPFELYSGSDFKTKNREQINKINRDFEYLLINTIKENGKFLLNVQNNKTKIKSTLKNKKNIVNYNKVINWNIDSNCIEFNVLKNQNIHKVINSRNDLPKSECWILLFNSAKPSELVYASKINKGWRKTGSKINQNIYKYFNNTDENKNRAFRWKIVQNEMIEKKIKEITVKVCESIIKGNNSESSNNLIPIPNKPITKIKSEKLAFPTTKGNKKITFLVPCSARKNDEELIEYDEKKHGTLSFVKELDIHRKNLLEKLQNCNKHEGTRKSKKVEIKKQFIDMTMRAPAYNLYSKGRLFTAAESNEWSTEQAEKVYIISALFGIIKATDYLPTYDLAIGDQLYFEGKKSSPFKFWKGELGFIIEKLINEGNVVYDLLSDNYRAVITKSASKLISTGEKWKYDRGSKRGKWLIQNIHT